METHPSEADLRAYLHGNLAAAENDAVAKHLDGCKECEAAVDRLEGAGRPRLRLVPFPTEKGLLIDSIPYPRIDGFVIDAELGRGGMAAVYKAREVATGRDVALKVPLDRTSQVALARFRAETELLWAFAGLTDSPGRVVDVFAVGEAGGVPFLSMPLAVCGTLSELLRTRSPELARAPRQAARLLAESAAAVNQLHTASPPIVHRDIKPSNLLLFPRTAATPGADGLFALEDLTVMLADLGLARDPERPGVTRTADLCGTPQYMAPEQLADGKVVSPTADVYSLGVVAYELLTGRRPFPDVTPPVLLELMKSQVPARPGSQNRTIRIPLELECICLKCLEFAPGRRYRTAGELAADLNRFLTGKERVRARLPGLGRRAWRWGIRNKQAVALLGVLFTSVALVMAPWVRVEKPAVGILTTTNPPSKQQPTDVSKQPPTPDDALVLDATPSLPLHPDRPRKVVDFAETHGVAPDQVAAWLRALGPNYFPYMLGEHAAAYPPQLHAIAVRLDRPERYLVSVAASSGEEMQNIDRLPSGYRPLAFGNYMKSTGPDGFFVRVSYRDTDHYWIVYPPTAKFEETVAERKKAGCRPILLVPRWYQNPNTTCICLIHAQGHDNWEAVRFLSLDDLRKFATDSQTGGQFIYQIRGYPGPSGEPRFDAIAWDNPDRRECDFKAEMTTGEYEAELIRRKALGFRPTTVTSYGDPSNPRFAAAWIRYFNQPKR